MEDRTMQKSLDTIFELPPPSVPGSRCRIRIFCEDGAKTIVIASHILGNRGRSITNAIEEVATKVTRVYPDHFSSAVREPVWVQHYPLRSLSLTKEERVHLVTFDRSADGTLTNPYWTHITEDHAEATFLYGLLNL